MFIDRGSKAEFVECIIRGNRALGGLSGQGGAGANAGNAEPLTAFEIPSFGGGVYCAAEAIVQFKNCLFQNNSASVTATQNFRLDPYIGYGGGVAVERSAAVVFVDCNFVDNVADTGGGAYLADSSISLLDSRVRSNTGLRGAGVAAVGGVVTITGCEIKNNEAILDATDTSDDGVLPIGAGLLLSSVTAYVQDCNIAANTSAGSGGGLYLRGENTAWIGNCLIRDNLAFRDGGGISTQLVRQADDPQLHLRRQRLARPRGRSEPHRLRRRRVLRLLQQLHDQRQHPLAELCPPRHGTGGRDRLRA